MTWILRFNVDYPFSTSFNPEYEYREKPKPAIILDIPAQRQEWMESDGKLYDWYAAMELGKDGWRLPTVIELLQLQESKLMPSDLCYWSSSPYAYGSGSAWFVNFGNGYVSNSVKDFTFYVRLVREVSGE